MKINSVFERSHIYYGDSFKKFQEKRVKSKIKLRLVSPIHFTEAKGRHLVEYVSGFHHKDHAKIWKAQKRVELLNKWIYLEEIGKYWYKLDKGIYGERDKTQKWLEKKSQQYPEYWL